MSGIDEQNRDIPLCPTCGDIPHFWILYPNTEQDVGNGWYWLFSDAYLASHTVYTKLEYREGYHRRGPTLNDVVSVLCGNYNNHKFMTDHPVFQEVMECARRIEG